MRESKMESLQSVHHRPLDQFTVNIRPDLGKPENQDAESYHASREVMHPSEVAEEPKHAGVHAKARDESIEAVRDFIGRVSSIQEGEYGDWQRRALLYWWHLVDALYNEPIPMVHQVMRDMSDIIEYHPTFLILETNRKIVEQAMKILEALGAPMRYEDAPVAK